MSSSFVCRSTTLLIFYLHLSFLFFFFQAEDGIRDIGVTGVQTCALPIADDEHTRPGKQMLLLGDTSTRLQAWDAIRSLDYLASLPMVDAKRIGGTGQSGGATLSMMLMATDDRLAAVVEFSGNTENVACA